MSHLPTNFRSHQTSTPYKIQKRNMILILSPWFLLILVDTPSPAIPGSPAMCRSEVRLRWPVATTKMDQAGDKSCLNSPDPWRQGIDEIFFGTESFNWSLLSYFLKANQAGKLLQCSKKAPHKNPCVVGWNIWDLTTSLQHITYCYRLHQTLNSTSFDYRTKPYVFESKRNSHLSTSTILILEWSVQFSSWMNPSSNDIIYNNSPTANLPSKVSSFGRWSPRYVAQSKADPKVSRLVAIAQHSVVTPCIMGELLKEPNTRDLS